MDLTSPQITMRDREITQLKEELAKERERAETRELALDAAVSSSCVLGAELAKERNKLEMAEAVIAGDGALITGLKNELAAAQATIAEMREAIGAWERADGNEELQEAEAKLIKAMNTENNLDALHEALAKECERLAKAHGVGVMKWLLEEAAAHRARKQATKEEGK